MTEFKQKSKVGVAGSLINQMMSNNSSLPEVGKGATRMHYTDRTCYEVIEVSDDYKTVKLEYLEASADPSKENGMGHQNWILKPTGKFVTVVWRNKAWRFVKEEIVFTDAIIKEANDNNSFPSKFITPAQHDEIFANGSSVWPVKVVDGITRIKKSYPKVNLIFGIKRYYYDWSF